MFLDLQKLKTELNLDIKGIIHVGAHLLEELSIYETLEIHNIVWIEANIDLVNRSLEKYPNQKILNYVVYDRDNVELQFNIANNGQSSSLLNFGTHSNLYPGIEFVSKKTIQTKTLKTIILENNINILDYNMLNLDIQGVELRAIIGLEDYLSNIDYIYTEINDDNVYENNDLLQDIDDYLRNKGFDRKETLIINGNWGDAIYVRKKNL